MYHKDLVDDRVRSALKEGVSSQEVARAMKAKRRQPGFLRRFFARLFTRRTRKEKEAAFRPQQTSLPRNP